MNGISQTTFKAMIEPTPGFEGSTLHAALAQLERWKLSPQQLSRVSLEADGTLQLEAQAAGSLSWFRYAGGKLHRARPQDDKKIPLLNCRLRRNSPGGMSVISYRPGRRVVLSSTGFGDGSIVKGFRKGRGSSALRRHEIAMDACANGVFSVPGLLDRGAGQDFIAMERYAGSTPVIAEENGSTWGSIGAGLRNFQDSCDCTELKAFGVAEELAVLDELARRFRLCAIELPRSWQGGREALESVAASLPRARTTAAHRDLHDGQFLVNGHRVHVLDFDLLCRADTALDAGNLLAHMALRDLQRDHETSFSASRVCGEAFLAGLQRQRDNGFEHRLLFYQAATFYRLALLYTLRPRWQHLVPSLVQLGQRRLAGAGDYVLQG